jgi:hypothetical protein
MAWLRIDDGFPEHEKLLSLRRNERWTWIEILAYCARQSNGGRLPASITNHMKYVTKPFLERCVEVGLLDVENGYFNVHDWNVYNPKDPTNAVRQRRYRNAKSNAPVTENVTEENVTTVTPRARATRPDPKELKPSFLPSQPEDREGTEGSETEVETDPAFDFTNILRSTP